MFYWGTHTRFTVSVGLDHSLTKTRRTRSADCICMDERAPLWDIVYYSDTCIVYLAVRETEYFTEIIRNTLRQYRASVLVCLPSGSTNVTTSPS